MTFGSSIKILIKTQLVAVFIILLYMIITMIFYTLKNKQIESDFSTLIFFIIFYYTIFSSVFIYTLGLITHRIFVYYKLYNFVCTIVSSIILTAAFILLSYITGALSRVDSNDVVIFYFVTLANCIIARYFTLKKLSA